ncbi:unnamed protein product [Trifolium pratense]|uniref:Uncharacterized protein n=1 Tax=Trifolium pratense TaxID=57577 RepID=A0ACB0J478_TRIPR|nr:unnamed protein product [Trifolium pratense]
MVVKTMKPRPWPPPISIKYEVKLPLVKTHSPFKLDGKVINLPLVLSVVTPLSEISPVKVILAVLTKDENDVVLWDREFHSFVNVSANKDNSFHPWEIAFTVFNRFRKNNTVCFPAFSYCVLQQGSDFSNWAWA